MTNLCSEHTGIVKDIEALQKRADIHDTFAEAIRHKVSMPLFMWVIGLIIGGCLVSLGYEIDFRRDIDKRVDTIDKEQAAMGHQGQLVYEMLEKIYKKMPNRGDEN